MPAWQFQTAQDRAELLLGADDNNNTQATTNVVANADGSVLERLESVQQATQRVPQLVSKEVTFTAEAYESGTAVPVFTVTGDVMVRAWGIVDTAVESDTGNDGTISLGIEDDVDVLIAVTAADETNFAAGDVWADNATQQGEPLPATGNWVVIANGEPIEINVLTEDITAGVMNLYVEWKPVSAGATVVAAA